jgi:hypothetical protein
VFLLFLCFTPGSEGKLTFPYQRVGMVSAILALSYAAGGKGTTALAGSISSYLITYYKDDGEFHFAGTRLSGA